MRFAIAFAAFGAACLAVPAQATVFNIAFSGNITGTVATWTCTQGAPIPCQFAFAPQTFFIQTGPRQIDLVEGINAFSFSYQATGDGVTGTLFNNNGTLTGLTLNYNQNTCGTPPTAGCVERFGSSTNYAITGGVPEPATWGLLLVGFLAMGATLRHRARSVRQLSV